MTKHLPIWLIIFVLFVFVVAVVLVCSYFYNFSFPLPRAGDKSEAHEIWGLFGDYVGGILNPLFSLITIAALLYTIILQSKELRESTKQLKLSADAFQKQDTVLEKQQFETTFFQMLTLFNEIINSMETTSPIPEYVKDEGRDIQLPITHDTDTEVIKGRKCFNEFYERLKRIYCSDHWSLSQRSEKDEIKQINGCYDWFYAEHQYELGHYFRMLYNIVKFVKNSNVSDKHFYTNIVRAQLSSQELLLLFYNALSELGNEKFKPLIEEFALLKTLPKKELFQSESHPKLYANSAYGSSIK